MFVLQAAPFRDDEPLSSPVSPLGDSAAGDGQELMSFFSSSLLIKPLIPSHLSLSSEVQYVVLQNVATMTIKRRVSFSYRHVCACGGCSWDLSPACPLLDSCSPSLLHRACLNRTWRVSTSAPLTRPRSKSSRWCPLMSYRAVAVLLFIFDSVFSFNRRHGLPFYCQNWVTGKLSDKTVPTPWKPQSLRGWVKVPPCLGITGRSNPQV